MRVIQNKSLAAGKVRSLGILFGVTALLCAFLAAGIWVFKVEVFYLALLGLFLVSAVSITYKAGVSWFAGDRGERIVMKGLEKLPDEYLAITNVVLPDTKQGDIDLLLLGPHGVLVVEVKTYAARYAANGDEWVNIKENGYRKKMKSPSRQLKRNVKAVENYLKKRGVPATVHGVLVLNDRADVKIEAPTVAVKKRLELAEYVRGLPGKEEWPGLEAAFGEGELQIGDGR